MFNFSIFTQYKILLHTYNPIIYIFSFKNGRIDLFNAKTKGVMTRTRRSLISAKETTLNPLSEHVLSRVDGCFGLQDSGIGENGINNSFGLLMACLDHCLCASNLDSEITT